MATAMAVDLSGALEFRDLRARANVRSLSSPQLSARSTASLAKSVRSTTSHFSVTSMLPKSGVMRCPSCSSTASLPMKRCPQCCGSATPASTKALLSNFQGTPQAGTLRTLRRAGSASRLPPASAPPHQPRQPQRRTVLECPEAGELLDRLRQGGARPDEVQRLLKESKAVVNVCEETFGWSPLLFAAHVGEPVMVELLLKSRADVQMGCTRGNTALHLAAAGGHARACIALIGRGADLEAKNLQGWTPLIWCAIAGQAQVAAALIAAAADVNARDFQERTACMWAARHGHAVVLRALLALGLDLTAKDADGRTVQDHAQEYEGLRKSLRIASATDVRAVGGAFVPHGLKMDGSLDLPQVLARRGSDAAPGDAQGASERQLPLEVIRAIVASTKRLLAAAKGQDWAAVKAALADGACASARDSSHLRAPLMWAAVHGDAANAMILVKAKADLETRDDFGWTALHHAVYACSAEVVSVLYFLGADFSARTSDGDLAVHLAARLDSCLVLQVMRPAVGDMEVRDGEGRTPLLVAAMCGGASALRTLVALGSDPRAKDPQGRGACQLAVMNGHEAVVHALLEPLPPLDPPPWREEDLVKMLQRLPWECQAKSSKSPHSRHRGARGHVLQAIAEGDSDAGSEAGGNELDEFDDLGRPDSARSAASMRSIASTASVASSASRMSAASRSSALSRASGASARTGVSRASSKASRRSVPRSVRSSQSERSVASRVGAASEHRSSGSVPGDASSRSPIGLLMEVCKSGAKAREAHVAVGESPLTRSQALEEGDPEHGSAALAQAVRFRQAQLLAPLLDLRADVNSSDRQGNTALMLAASRGDASAVAILLEGGARADLCNASGRCAADTANGAALRSMLSEHAAKDAVGRRLGTSCSLPALIKHGSAAPSVNQKTGVRLRIDGLAVRLSEERLGEMLRDIVKDCGAASPREVDVPVDPIRMRPTGSAYLLFADEAQTREAEQALLAESTLRVALEAY